jgi:ATP-binding cassette subfamily F protein 1
MSTSVKSVSNSAKRRSLSTPIKTTKTTVKVTQISSSKDEEQNTSQEQKVKSLIDGFTCTCLEDTMKSKVQESKSLTIQSKSFSISIPGRELFKNAELNIQFGQKYGLIGKNGLGKTTLLKHLYQRRFPTSNSLNIIYVEQEIQASKLNPVDVILSNNEERFKIIQKIKKLEAELETNDQYDLDEYESLNEKLRMLGGDRDEHIVKKILHGLGFSLKDQEKPVRLFSGGWRMRIALAKALYMEPELLILDEPTNHLDLNAVLWLTQYLKTYRKTLVLVSHDRNFLNEIVSEILNIEDGKLISYSGNYDSFQHMYKQKLLLQEKIWEKYSKDLKKCHNKDEKEKLLEKYEYPKRPEKEYKVCIPFQNSYLLDPPLLTAMNVSFEYKEENSTVLFKNLNFDVTLGCRIALVGPNGVGKTTLLNLLTGKEKPQEGEIIRNPGLRIGYYSQHFANNLPNNCKVMDFLNNLYEKHKDPYVISSINNVEQYIRRFLGLTGLENKHHSKLISELSGGQKARVAFVSLFMLRPHVLLLDEPTNHLDMETVDELIESLELFNGALVLISHNLDLIRKTNSRLYILRPDTYKIERYHGDINDYEKELLEKFNA